MRNKLTKINLYDKFNAAFVSLITPEMPQLNRLRRKNHYSKTPDFEKPFEMPLEYQTINGVKVRMAKSIIDEQKKETVILLSAFPQSILAYSPIWEELKSQYNLYAYDLPGFAGSQAGSDYMSFGYQAEFLNAFIEYFGIHESHIVAPDVGMPSALTYLINYDHKMKSIMLGDGPAVLPAIEPSVMKKMVYSKFWRMMFVIAGNGALVESAKNLCNIRYVPNKYEISDYKSIHKGKVAYCMSWFKKYPKDLKNIDQNLSSINLPVKVFWGEFDAILNKENAENLHKKLPNSELEIFKNCGHFVYQDDYQGFIQLVKDWVEKHK